MMELEAGLAIRGQRHANLLTPSLVFRLGHHTVDIDGSGVGMSLNATEQPTVLCQT